MERILNDIVSRTRPQLAAAGAAAGFAFCSLVLTLSEHFRGIILTGEHTGLILFIVLTVTLFGASIGDTVRKNAEWIRQVTRWQNRDRVRPFALPPYPDTDSLQLVIGEKHDDQGKRVAEASWFTLEGSALYTGVLVVGDTGSGKTTCAGYPWLEKMLQSGLGGLVLDAGGSYVRFVQQEMAALGRESDLIVIEPGGPHQYNPVYKPDMTSSDLAGSPVGAEYQFAGLRDRGLINPSIPVYFHRGEDFQGKAYFGGKTYKMRAAHRDGALKVFLDDDGMISVDPSKPTPSFLQGDKGNLIVTYTATMEKADLQGKEQQLAANYAALGTVPETVAGAPNVWGTYFEMSQKAYTAQDVMADPTLRAVFGHRQSSSAMGSIALELAAKRQARPAVVKAAAGSQMPGLRFTRTPKAEAAAADPDRPKTDAELEKEMQQAYKKRRY